MRLRVAHCWTKHPHTNRSLRTKKSPLARAFWYFWRRRRVRLHAAGRCLACKPSPSNLSRDVRRDIARSARKKARLRGHFGISGGDGEIRTLDTGLSPYASLAGKCLRPLGHVSTCNPQDSRDFAKGWMIAFSAGLVNLRIFPDQTLYAARAQLTPCIFHRSRPKS